MLLQLAIRDIVLIETLDLAFEAGLGVFTGETGAGKSILLDSLSLALGARGDGGLVRHGQAQGQVTAVFELPAGHAGLALAREAGAAVEDVLILRRVQMADGRSRAYLNDQPVGVQVLRAIGATLVEIHGQHDERALVNADHHRDLLDAFGGLEGQAGQVRSLSAAWREAETAFEAQAARIAAAKREQEYLAHVYDELSRLQPLQGEEHDLALRRQTMMASEKVAAELAEAQEVIAGTHSPIPLLSAMLRRLERRAAQAPALVEPAVKAIDAALGALDEARGALEASLRAADFDPADLERIEERLFALRAAARKHSVPVDDLPALAERFRADLAAIATGEADLAALDRARGEAAKAYRAQAGALSAARHAAAGRLDSAVTAELAPLKLERARFITEMISDDRASAGAGFDRVEFHVQTNPGTRPGPLMKVASGGELSRFMLALKVALADRGSAPTLVFDEIDSGAGGAVADAIGQRLSRLATRIQVLAVTHAPQVAARAKRHMLIAKEAVEGGERVATRVRLLDADTRREEIARMLSGEVITGEARAAAERLLVGSLA